MKEGRTTSSREGRCLSLQCCGFFGWLCFVGFFNVYLMQVIVFNVSYVSLVSSLVWIFGQILLHLCSLIVHRAAVPILNILVGPGKSPSSKTSSSWASGQRSGNTEVQLATPLMMQALVVQKMSCQPFSRPAKPTQSMFLPCFLVCSLCMSKAGRVAQP